MASLGRLRKAVIVPLAIAVLIALQSCSAQQPSAAQSSAPTAFEPHSSVVRAPLSPPIGYAAQGSISNSPIPTSYDPSSNEGAQPEGKWRASPRWSAVQGDGCVVVDYESSVPGHIKVEKCPSNEGLQAQSPARGY